MMPFPQHLAEPSRRRFLKYLASAAAGPALVSGRLAKCNDVSRREIFTDITEQAGISWRHFCGESEDRFLIEATTGGVGFIDYDGDGLLDIYLVNGGETPRGTSPLPVRNALYRNLGKGRFEEVAAQAGVDRIPFYGMGVAAADYDNDGHQDLFVTGYPACALFHNNGNGNFTDVSDQAGVKNAGRWAAGAAWFDYDRDGFLDLFVCNYVEFSFNHPQPCTFRGNPTYCSQTAFPGQPLTLFHNNRDGTFTNVSARAGLQKHVGRALGVVAIDADNDGWPDLFVARDAHPNLLLINRHDGTFEDLALDAEVAFDENGMAKAGMGVDAGDANGDGWPDFVVSNFNDEYHSLFLNRGSFPYANFTSESGLAALTRHYVGWGTHFVDYDNDGNLDLVIVNGHINPVIELSREDVSYKEPLLLLRNNGKAIFEAPQRSAGTVLTKTYSGRGLAVGDFDDDGGVDLILACLNDRPVVLRNNVGAENSWIGFKLQGTKSNRDAIGAKLTATLPSGRRLVRWITGGSSFLASHDKRVVFGLGTSSPREEVQLEISWPSGTAQKVSGLEPGQYHNISEAGSHKG